MNKYILVLILITTCLQTGLAQKKVPFDQLDEFNGVTHQKNHQEPFNGKGVGYYGNGQLWKEMKFKDGRITGLAKEWDLQGNLITEAEYKMGVRYGRETQYFENGKKQLEVYYQNGKATGTVTEWYENGQMMSRGEVLNGQYLGKHTWFYPTGEKEQVIEYRNGVAEGKVQLWYIDGKLRKSTDFTKGQPNGKQIEWYKSGVKMSEQDFVNATKHGEFKYWGKDERLLERKVYEEGRVVKAEDYNSASLRLPEGYAYVFNLLNSNFVLKMIGNKVEPVSTDGLAFYVDGSIVQYFTVATSEFKGEQETIDDTELWKRFLEDEKNRVEYQLDTTVEIRQKAFVLKNGKAEGVFWSFDLPEPITKGKLKIVQEQYIALKVQNYIVQINGFVLNETKPEKLEAELAKILETIEIMDKPIDIIEYVKNAVKY